jgi:hypothetical protein
MKNLENRLQEHKNKYGKIDTADLDMRFKEAYENGRRVEVEWQEGFEDYSGYGNRTDGRKARFCVGMSTGWKPVFLQIYSVRSSGGQAILSSAVKSIKYVK